MVSMKAVLVVCLLSVLSAHGTHGHGSLCSFDMIPKPESFDEEPQHGHDHKSHEHVNAASAKGSAESHRDRGGIHSHTNTHASTYGHNDNGVDYEEEISNEPEYRRSTTVTHGSSEASAQSEPWGSRSDAKANAESTTYENTEYPGFDDIIGPNYGTTSTNYAYGEAGARSGPWGSSADSNAGVESVTTNNNGYDYVGPNGQDYTGPNRPDYVDSIGPDYMGPNGPDYVELDYLEQDYLEQDYLEQDYVLRDNVGPNGPDYEEPNSAEYIDSYGPDYKRTTIITTTTANSKASAQTSPEGSTSEANVNAEAVTTTYGDLENRQYYIGPKGKQYYIGSDGRLRRVKNTAISGGIAQTNPGGSNVNAYGETHTYDDDVPGYDDISLIDDYGTSESSSSSSESESDELDSVYSRWSREPRGIGSWGQRRTRRQGWGRYPWGYGRRGPYTYPWNVDSDESDKTTMTKNVYSRGGKRRYPYGRRRYVRGRWGPYRGPGRKPHDEDWDGDSTKIKITSTEGFSSEETDQYRYGKWGWGKYGYRGSNPLYQRNRPRHPPRSTTKRTQTTTTVDGETVYDTEDYDTSPLLDYIPEYSGTDYTTYPNDATDTTTTTVDTYTNGGTSSVVEDYSPDDYQPDNTDDESWYKTLTGHDVYGNYDETQSSATATATSGTTTNGDSTISVTEATANADAQTDDGPDNGPDYSPEYGPDYSPEYGPDYGPDDPDDGPDLWYTYEKEDDDSYRDEIVSNDIADAADEVVPIDDGTDTTTVATAEAKASSDTVVELRPDDSPTDCVDDDIDYVLPSDRTEATTNAYVQSDDDPDDGPYNGPDGPDDPDDGPDFCDTYETEDDDSYRDEIVSNASADAAVEVVPIDDETGTTTVATAEAEASSDTGVELRPDDSPTDCVDDDIDYILPSDRTEATAYAYAQTDDGPDNGPDYSPEYGPDYSPEYGPDYGPDDPDDGPDLWYTYEKEDDDSYRDEIVSNASADAAVEVVPIDDETGTTTVATAEAEASSDTGVELRPDDSPTDCVDDDIDYILPSDRTEATAYAYAQTDDGPDNGPDYSPEYGPDYSPEYGPDYGPDDPDDGPDLWYTYEKEDDDSYRDEIVSNASADAAVEVVPIDDETGTTTVATAEAEASSDTGVELRPDDSPTDCVDDDIDYILPSDRTEATAYAYAQTDDGPDNGPDYSPEYGPDYSPEYGPDYGPDDPDDGPDLWYTYEKGDDDSYRDEIVSNASADAAVEVVPIDDETGTTTVATAEAEASSDTVVESRPDDSPTDYVDDDIDYILPSSENHFNDLVYPVDTDYIPDNYPLDDNDEETWLNNPGVDTYPEQGITDDGTTITTVTETNYSTDIDSIDYVYEFRQVDPYPGDMTSDDEVIATTVSGHNDDDNLDSLDCEPGYVSNYPNEDSPIDEPECIDEIEANASRHAEYTTSDSTWQTTTSTAIAETDANTSIISYPDNDPLYYPEIRFCFCFRKASEIPRNIREQLGMA